MFNGSTAVVKQCAEIILIRLGQPDDKMSPAPPIIQLENSEDSFCLNPVKHKNSGQSVIYELISWCHMLSKAEGSK